MQFNDLDKMCLVIIDSTYLDFTKLYTGAAGNSGLHVLLIPKYPGIGYMEVYKLVLYERMSLTEKHASHTCSRPDALIYCPDHEEKARYEATDL